jgi:hypothetical protein
VCLLGVELASFAGAYDLGSVGYRSGLVETLPEGVPNEGPRCCVVPTGSRVDIAQQLFAIVDGDTSLEDSRRAASVQLPFFPQ